MFTAAKAKSRPRPRFIAWSIQTMANGSSRRAFFNGPASTGSKPSLPTSSITWRFLPASSPATSMSGLTGKSAPLAILPAPVVLSVLKTKAPGAQSATCSPAEVSKPRTSCKPSLPMPNGFMQSITVLPARLPRLLTAASAADQGVAITTTSAALTASAGALTRSLGSAACFGSAGLRSPQITSSPRSIQARPSVAPTDPAPMIAIRMNTSWFALLRHRQNNVAALVRVLTNDRHCNRPLCDRHHNVVAISRPLSLWIKERVNHELLAVDFDHRRARIAGRDLAFAYHHSRRDPANERDRLGRLRQR